MKLKKFYSIFINPFISPIIAAAVIIVLLMGYFLPEISKQNEIHNLTQEALASTNKLKEIRSYYTDSVISKVKKQGGVKINFDHYTQEDTIPLPATLLHNLSEIVPRNGMKIKMFSDYPFPNRTQRVLDQYEVKGLRFVEENPSETFVEIVKENQQEFLKITVADIFFDQACVQCHNTRADSPKTNWRLGDVRGALQVTLPLKNGIVLTHQQTLWLFGILILMTLVLGIHYGIISYLHQRKLGRDNIELNEKVAERTKTLNQYKNAMDLSAIVSKTNKNGAITYVNEEFIKISQFTQEELIGRNHNIIRHPDTPDSLFKELWETIKQKKVWQGQIANLAKDGTTYYVSSTIVPILNAKDEIEEYLAVRFNVSDIVESKLKAEKADIAKSTFLANISHEIRTPLNAIIGFSQVLSSAKEIPNENKKQANIVHSSANNLLSIINDILDVSKIESGNFEVSIEDTDIYFVCEHVVELFSKRAMQKDIKFVFNMDTQIPHCIQTDGVRIRQVLSNLLGNAIKFTPREGEVTLNIVIVSDESSKNQMVLRFEVLDTGIGIEKEKIENIFKPFIQVDDNVNRKYEGTGLGLSICSHIVKSLNSKIEVESEVGVGSKFWFEMRFDICDDLLFSSQCDLRNSKFKILEPENQLQKYMESYLSLFGVAFQKENIDENCIVMVAYDDIKIAREKYPNHKTIALFETENQLEKAELFQYEIPLPLPFYGSKISDTIDKVNHIKVSKLNHMMHNSQDFKGKILVAEDNLGNQELIRYMLDIFHLSYEIVSDGQEAVDSFKQTKFDLVFMDINMPVLDGVESFKMIRKYERENNLPTTPIIALTANAIKGDQERFLSLGMNDYISKPIQTEKLEEVLKKHLSTKSVAVPQYQKTNGEKKTLNAKDISNGLGVSESIGAILIKKFQAEIPKDLDELEKYILQNDLENIQKKAHFIKNSCLNLALDDICRLLQKIETQENDRGKIEAIFQEIKNEIGLYL